MGVGRKRETKYLRLPIAVVIRLGGRLGVLRLLAHLRLLLLQRLTAEPLFVDRVNRALRTFRRRSVLDIRRRIRIAAGRHRLAATTGLIRLNRLRTGELRRLRLRRFLVGDGAEIVLKKIETSINQTTTLFETQQDWRNQSY